MPRVLVCGASVAGVTTAHWLARHGFSVTVAERAAGPRRGGQAVDVRSTALKVLDRMGARGAVRQHATATQGMSFVDAQGSELWRDTSSTLSGGRIDSPDIEIVRDDLVDDLIAVTRNVRWLYGTTIAAIDDEGSAVSAGSREGWSETFNLVIGADGLHSTVRRLIFGPEASFARNLGVFLAICSAPNFLDLRNWQMWFHDEASHTLAALMSVRDNTEARALLTFTDNALRVEPGNVAAQLATLDARFSGQAWVVPQLLTAMHTASDFYFEEATQIRLATWSRGRVVLVGDAAHCLSPVGGHGTSAALLGGYILASELAAARVGAGIDHNTAYGRYEAQLRPSVEAIQSLADQTTTDGQTPHIEEISSVFDLLLDDLPEDR